MAVVLGSPVDNSWQVKGVADFDGDGRTDILWQHTSGWVAIWYMVETDRIGDTYGIMPDLSGRSWTIQGLADLNGNARADILWRSSDGYVDAWF